MSFDLPWHFCAVTENGLKVAHFAAETYDPRRWNGQGADASYEPGMDKEGRFARVWIEYQSAARIVVRVQYALNNSKYEIAHDDFDTGSPYNNGKGDWGEERFTIYPDGTYVRHMQIHSGLAAESLPTGFFREPPQVVHEFMESVVIGPRGHRPTDDIQTKPTLTLMKMFGASNGEVFAGGLQQPIDYKLPAGPPRDYGDFRDANIMLIHTNSKYRPYTVGLPYGARVSPYGWEEDRRYPFATWTGYQEPTIGYISALGHLVNYWHYRRTEKTIEQVYLHGMVSSVEPAKEIMPAAWSWVMPPELQMPDAKLSPNGSAGEYRKLTYDPTQRAYVVPRETRGPQPMRFRLVSIYDDEILHGTMWLVNPAIIIKDWDSSADGLQVQFNGHRLREGTDYRVGSEIRGNGRDLVLWIHKTVDLTAAEDHAVSISIEPKQQ
ncbi:MAG: hypothetical protein U0892_10035 [Pirellulales bacterium]